MWDLATKARTSYVLPDQMRRSAYLGLTSKHLWVTGSPQPPNDVKDSMFRFLLK